VKAKNILDKWDIAIEKFVKVFPLDYNLALQRIKAMEIANSEQIQVTEEVSHG